MGNLKEHNIPWYYIVLVVVCSILAGLVVINCVRRIVGGKRTRQQIRARKISRKSNELYKLKQRHPEIYITPVPMEYQVPVTSVSTMQPVYVQQQEVQQSCANVPPETPTTPLHLKGLPDYTVLFEKEEYDKPPSYNPYY